MLRLVLMLCAVISLGWMSPAQARRAALIIGNSNYAHAGLLPNPVKDADLVAQAARKAGFDVTLIDNLAKSDFDQALREFRGQADGAEVAMIYFAGHGIENGGKNWIIPTDAALAESRDLRFEAIELDGLLETLVGSRLRIVVLDACRDNPFGANWRSTVRTIPKGLAEAEVEGEGALILFAAAGGQVATDGMGANSPFATALAARLPEPRLSIHRLGSVIRQDVINATGGKQTPWTNMSIDGSEFFLVDEPQTAVAAAPAPGGAATGYNAGSDPFAWRYYSDKNTIEAYGSYLREFPQGMFATQANERIAQLRAGSTRVSAAPVAPRPVPSPEPAKPAPVKPAPAAIALPTEPDPVGPAVNVVLPKPTNLVDMGPLPQMPATPLFPREGYPVCREEYQAVPDAMSRVNRIIACQNQLNSYYDTTMNGFAQTMIQHQKAITRMYQEQVGGKEQYSPESQDRFYQAMMKEHSDSNPDGPYFQDYRATQKRYDEDRAYLADRYCANTGACGGYPVPAGMGVAGK